MFGWSFVFSYLTFLKAAWYAAESPLPESVRTPVDELKLPEIPSVMVYLR